MISSLVMVLALAGCGQGQEVDISANGRVVTARSEIKYDRMYVALDPLAKAMGLTVGFDHRKPEHGVLVQRGDAFVHLHTDQNDCHVSDGVEGDRTVRLDAPAVYIDHVTHRPMVPVAFVSEVFGADVRYEAAANRTRGMIEIRPAR